MRRFFVNSKDISKGKIIISAPLKVHHIRDVLRYKEKDTLILLDETGKEYTCLIEKISDKILLNIKETKSSLKNMDKVKITVACAIPKKSNMDDIIDKLTQIGIDRIIPIESSRVIVKLNPQKRKIRYERWNRIACSSSEQSLRGSLPVIEPIKEMKEVLKESLDYDLKLIPTLYGKRETLKEVLAKSCPKSILILIGPEGDFTEEEIALARNAGCIPVSLGDLVMRVETAAVAVASFIRLSFL